MSFIWAQFVSLFKRYPRAFICGFLSIILVFLIFFRMQLLPTLQETETASNKQLDVIMRNQSQGVELGEQLAELKRLTAGMQSRLMIEPDKAANLQFFYDIESRSRANIIDIAQTTLDVGDGTLRPKLTEFSGLGFNVSVSGRVGYVMSFLKRMENGKYFVRCNSAVLRGNKTLGPDAVDIVLKLEVLSKKP